MSLPAAVVEKSENGKLSTNSGCSATYASQASCPKDCPFRNNGCYAEIGYTAYTTSKLNKSKETRPTMIAKAEARLIRNLSGMRPLRLHVVGDCPNRKSARIIADACSEYSNKHNQIVWGYTHNRKIPREDWGNISILRSCTSLRQAQTALRAGFASALVVPEFKDRKRHYIGRGMNGIPCPAQTGLAKSCVDCKLCMKEEWLRKNNLVILFHAHGTCKNKVVAYLKGIGS